MSLQGNLLIFLVMCLCVGIFMLVQVPTEDKGLSFPGTRVT